MNSNITAKPSLSNIQKLLKIEEESDIDISYTPSVTHIESSPYVNDIGDYRREDVDGLLGSKNIEELGRNFQLLFTFSDYKPIILHESPEVGCQKCDETASVLLYLRKDLHIDKSIISDILIGVCKKSADKNDRVCEDKINSALDQLLYIFDFGNNVTPEKICTLRMGPTCHNQFKYLNWTISIPDKPVTVPKKIAQQNDRNLRVLQLSDLHLDPLYTPGARSKCGEPICCQIDQMPVNPDEETCGIWGDYEEADTPRKTFEDVLRQTRTHKDIDFVYFTGDMVGHRTWSWGKNESSIIEKEVMERLMENFDVPVLFVLGNHDSFPYNL
ncbi:hypothetical protein WA026_002916 [Henosepilachna vigintioctopunctata]|uniref:Calcineurin-like phosphoesterase domain-containing protein n=1 Tax=Henosepilachna vigintioctopunctata TaxID=420089 RepID=A0AAW1TLQ3_9CUCU